MELSSIIVSSDRPEVSVLECILSSLHMDVEVEQKTAKVLERLARTNIDAVIVDCDLAGTAELLSGLHSPEWSKPRPIVIVSGSDESKLRKITQAEFVVAKPVSVERAVHVLSGARNLILKTRLSYHRQTLDVPVSLMLSPDHPIKAHLLNLSQGGIRVRLQDPQKLSGAVQVHFDLPDTKVHMDARGEVAWVDKRGNAGIRLVEIGDDDRRSLRLWLERQYIESSAGKLHC
jgi:hypothetical protein